MSFPLKDIARTSIRFKTRIAFNGRQLSIKMPESMIGRRCEAVYSDGKLIVSLVNSGGALIFNNSSNSGDPRPMCRLGKSYVKGVPVGSFKADVEMFDGHFVVDVPRAPSSVRHIPTPEVAPVNDKNPRESALRCIKYLNSFASKNGFTFDVTGGQLSLVKEDRIS